MNRRIALFTSLLLGFALLFAPRPASAEDSATAFVQGKQQELIELLRQPANAKSDKRVAKVFDELLDYDELARRSLADHWTELSPKQQKEFSDVLKQLVQNAYRKNLRKTLDYEVRFAPERQGKDGTFVRTTAKNRKKRSEEPIQIDYVVHRLDGEWRVFDIVTEGSSLVSNYRSQFARVIKKKGYEKLLEAMKKKLAKERGG